MTNLNPAPGCQRKRCGSRRDHAGRRQRQTRTEPTAVPRRTPSSGSHDSMRKGAPSDRNVHCCMFNPPSGSNVMCANVILSITVQQVRVWFERTVLQQCQQCQVAKYSMEPSFRGVVERFPCARNDVRARRILRHDDLVEYSKPGAALDAILEADGVHLVRILLCTPLVPQLSHDDGGGRRGRADSVAHVNGGGGLCVAAGISFERAQLLPREHEEAPPPDLEVV
mmetsp:Transcript_10342/g.24815  ORF Transcript_10342/g.24815 Transcript_10342/m.24815 type:complete len:225 (-) Transcript_10342:144-818(-)